MTRDMAERGPAAWCFFKRRVVALAGDDDGRVWWPAVGQHESDQLATHGPGEEEEVHVRVRVRHVWRGTDRGNCVRWPAGTTSSNLKDSSEPLSGGARLYCRPASGGVCESGQGRDKSKRLSECLKKAIGDA